MGVKTQKNMKSSFNDIKERKPLVGVLHSYQVLAADYQAIERVVSAIGARLRWINHDETRSSFSAIIIPDGIGINPLAPGLQNLPHTGGCPSAIQFCFGGTLDWYIQANYPIIGIGDGAANLWCLTGHKVRNVQGKLCMVPPKLNETFAELVLDEGLVSQWKFGNLYGIPSARFLSQSQLLKVVVSEEDEREDEKPKGYTPPEEDEDVFYT